MGYPDPATAVASLQIHYKNGEIKTKAKSALVEELRKSINKRLFQSQITAQTNKFYGIRIGRSTAPGISNTVDQAAWRAKYAACVAQWNDLTPEEQAAYQEDADKRRITAFNQFMSACLLVTAEALFERYITGDDNAFQARLALWCAQTFTIGNTGPNKDHNVISVILLLYRTGNPGTLIVSIRNTAAGLPIGEDLAVGTTDGNTLPTGPPYEWRKIELAPQYKLLANTQYAVVWRAPDGDFVNHVWARYDGSAPAYGGGTMVYSFNAGAFWIKDSGLDFLFKEYGIPT